jgi:16S rRNA (uracil1498-N3)-methyltransferase
MPDIIDQAVQLGVSHISPLISVHTNNREFNLERYKKIAKEALEQSNRCDSVEILPPMPLEAFVSQAFELILFANETEKEKNLLNIQTWPEKLALLIGPEGGFSQSEIAYLSSNARSISLGENILKAPTACTALLSQISLLRSNTSRLN